MSAIAESVGPQLEQLQQKLLLAGDVQLSQVMARMRSTWSKARVQETKRAESARVEAAKRAAIGRNVVLTVELPIHTFSEKNTHVHWGKKQKLMGDIRPVVRMAMTAHANVRGIKVSPPCSVRMIRLAPTELDAGDNLEMSLFRVRDAIADWLGINDRSPTVTWECEQERSRTYGVRVEVMR